jgi:hypothetical protein
MCARVRAACWAVMACALLACSGGGESLPHGPGDQTGIPPVNRDAAPNPTQDGGRTTCSPGETQDCVIDRGTFMGIHDCALGTQACGEDGQWADCIEL